MLTYSQSYLFTNGLFSSADSLVNDRYTTVQYSGPSLGIKVFPDIGISIKKIRRSWGSALFPIWMYKTPSSTQDKVYFISSQCIFDISFRSHPY